MKEDKTRVYFTTTLAIARTILRDGFADMHEEFGLSGVWFADRQLDAGDGFEGELTLCLDLPDDEFERYELREEDAPASHQRMALVPAQVANRFGPAKIYDHIYAGNSRVELLRFIRVGERHADEHHQRPGREVRAAMAFFDEIGWLTPVKVQEAQGK
jgi:hypothetical protein